jgi:hypothetical protein
MWSYSMCRTSARLAIAGALLTAIMLTGCDAVQQAQNAAKRQDMMNNLKQLGIAYHNCHDAMQRGPLNWQEAAQYGVPSDAQAAMEAAGYTVHWGIKMADATGGTSLFVLAYPANAATEGGAVLMLDGSVHQMTAQEFSDALAKQKVDSPKAMATATGAAVEPAPAEAANPADGLSAPGLPAAPGY